MKKSFLATGARFSISSLLCAMLFLLAGVIPSAQGAVKSWNGTVANGNFNVSGNWSPSGAPAAGDDLIFPAGPTQLLVTNNFSPNRAFSTILFLQSSNNMVLKARFGLKLI